MCNVFVKIASALILVLAIIFNFFGNLFGVGDIIPTAPKTTETTLTETSTYPEESTTEPTTEESTTEESTTETTTNPPVTAPKPTKPTTAPDTTGTTSENTTKPGTTVEFGPKVEKADIESLADFGGMNTDTFTSAQAVAKGGFVVSGVSASTDGDFKDVASDWSGNSYGYVAMFDSEANPVWIKATGSSNAGVRIEDVAVLSDGSVVAVGYTTAEEFAANTENKGSIESFIVKYSADGTMQWQKAFGGKKTDMFMSVAPLGNGFVVGGKTDSTDGSFAGNGASSVSSALLIRFDKDANVIWSRYLAGNYGASVDGIDTDANENIFFTSITAASTGDFELDGMGKGYLDTAVFKYNGNGERQWGVAVASSGRDNFKAVAADGDGGCVVAGNYELVTTYLPDGTFANLHNCGGIDAVVIRFNANGTTRWMRSVAGFADDFINDIVKTADGGFAVAGYTTSSNRDFATVGNKGQNDAFAALITPAGNLADVKALGGARRDSVTNVVYTTNGKLIVLGQTTSGDGDFDGMNTHLTDSFINIFGDAYTGFIAKYGVTISSVI